MPSKSEAEKFFFEFFDGIFLLDVKLFLYCFPLDIYSEPGKFPGFDILYYNWLCPNMNLV